MTVESWCLKHYRNIRGTLFSCSAQRAHVLPDNYASHVFVEVWNNHAIDGSARGPADTQADVRVKSVYREGAW